jgi:hypothetical protein
VGRSVTTGDGKYVIDGSALNKLLETYQLNTQMLPGQVFDIVEKKLIKTLLEEIETAKALIVHFVNLEAIPSGPYGDFSYAICGGLAELIDSLSEKKIMVTATIADASSLPQNLISRIDKSLEGHKPPDSAVASP